MAVFIDPRTGERFDSVPDEDAERARGEFGLVPEAEYERERQYGGGGGAARAFGEAAAAGAFDAAVAPVRLATGAAGAVAGLFGANDTARQLEAFGEQLGGRQFVENVTAVASELAGESATAEVAAERYSEAARARAETNPWASTSGYIGGQVLGAAATGLAGASGALGKAAASSAASSALGKAAMRAGAEGAVEGALLAGGQAGEEAWIRHEKLTAEQTMAALGWGTLLGAGAGGALGSGIYGAGAVRRRAGEAVGAAGERLASLFGPKASASAETVAEVASGALGVKVRRGEGAKIKDALEWARTRVEGAQVATTGVDPDAVRKYGALRWDAEAVSGRQAFIDREANLEGAKRAMTDGVQEYIDAVEPVIDEIRYSGLKREHVAAAIDKERVAEQLADARTQAQAVESLLVPIRRPGSAAKATREAAADLPIERDAYLATFGPEDASAIDDELDDEIRETLEALGKKTDEGTRAWKRVEQDVLRERVARQTPAPAPLDPREGTLRGEVGNAGVLDEVERFVGRHLGAIAKTTDPVEAFMQLDSLKRGLQKYADRTGRSAAALVRTSPERAAGMRKVSDLIERFQEPVRQSLENEAVWGKAATNQRAVNAALTRQIEGGKLFRQRYVTETLGYRGLDRTLAVRPEAVGAFLNKVGLADNAANEAALRAHLRATDDVLRAMDGALDLGEKKALVQKALGVSERLGKVVADLDRNVRVGNQIAAILEADREGVGNVGKTAVGALLGGPLGAAAGLVADVATHPGASMRTAIGLQRLAKRHDVRLDEAIGRLFGAEQKAARSAADDAAQAAAARRPITEIGQLDEIKRRTDARWKHLTAEEREAVEEYSRGSASFRRQLTGEESMDAQTSDLLSALDKLAIDDPTAVGPLYRGTRVTPIAAREFEVGARVHLDNRLSSTTYFESIADGFARQSHVLQDEAGQTVPVLFQIDDVSTGTPKFGDEIRAGGVDRSAPRAPDGSRPQRRLPALDREAEVIVDGGIYFEITAVERRDGVLRVTLRERPAGAAAPETAVADVAGASPANDVGAGELADEISEVRARPPLPASSAVSGRVAVPVALATFLGSHEDKQSAFKARAREIHEATADMGEKVRAVVQRDMADVSAQFPGFTGSLAAGLTRAALFLESKLPPSYRAAAPGSPGRSTRPVADHDIAKFARYWSAVHDPVSVLHDLALGVASGEQLEALRVVYPELNAKVSETLLEKAADADARGVRLSLQTRTQIGRLLGVQLEPAFRTSVLDALDRARSERDQGGGGSRPPNLASSVGPESVQIEQRAARVG